MLGAVQMSTEGLQTASRMHARALRDLESANRAAVILLPDDGLVVVHAADAATADSVLYAAVGVIQGATKTQRGARGPDRGGGRGVDGAQRRERGGSTGRGGDGDGQGAGRHWRREGHDGGGGGSPEAVDVPPWRQAVRGGVRERPKEPRSHQQRDGDQGPMGSGRRGARQRVDGDASGTAKERRGGEGGVGRTQAEGGTQGRGRVTGFRPRREGGGE